MNQKEAPHFTKEWLLSALSYVRRDFEATITQSVNDDRALIRLQTAQNLGLDTIAHDAITAIDQAIVDANNLQWPGGIEIRYVALLGALKSLASASTALQPNTPDLPHLSYLTDLMRKAEYLAASNFRRRLAKKFTGIYVIVDPELTNGRDIRWVMEQSIKGGASAIQLRVKNKDKGDWLKLTSDVSQVCNSEDVVFIVNDHADIAVASNSHGVHLGQHDLPPESAREVLNPWQLIGTSNALLTEAQDSYRKGCDYLAVGRMFPTSSKSNTRHAGLETLSAIRESIPEDGPPIIAIGGINLANANQAKIAGADCICVISAVTLAKDPCDAVVRLRDAFLAS